MIGWYRPEDDPDEPERCEDDDYYPADSEEDDPSYMPLTDFEERYNGR